MDFLSLLWKDPSRKSTIRNDCFRGKVPSSLLELSADLQSVFERQIKCDFTLFIGDRSIECHKAILRARSPWFAYRIDQLAADEKHIIINNENERILDALLVYIYTGNLILVESLKVPLLDLWLAATEYGMDRFKKLLGRMMKSRQKPGPKKDIEFLWKININDYKSDMSTFSFRGFSLDGTDKWCLKLMSLDFGGPKHSLCVCVARQTTNGNKRIIHRVDLLIHILDSHGKKIKSIKSDCVFSKDCKIKMSEPLSLCKLKKFPGLLLQNDCVLSLSGRLTVAAEDLASWQGMLFQVNGDHEKSATNELHALSHDMYKLLKSSKYTDTEIVSKDSASLKVKVHAYILSARSSIPIDLIDNFMKLRCSGDIVMRSFVLYLYTGQPRYLEDHMREVYLSVCELKLSETKTKYSRILANNLTEENVFHILIEAIKYEDSELIYSALYFIGQNNLFDSTAFTLLDSLHPVWANEMMIASRHKKTT